MAFLGFIIAILLFRHYQRRLRYYQRRGGLDQLGQGADWEQWRDYWNRGASWHEEWHRQWGAKFHHHAERNRRESERQHARRVRRLERQARRMGVAMVEPTDRAGDAARAGARQHAATDPAAASYAKTEHATAERAAPESHRQESSVREPRDRESEILRRARRRASAEFGFYRHLMTYLGVMAFLALMNLFTTRYPWFIWPASCWGMGLFAHYMAVFGSRSLKARYFDPAVEREVSREKAAMQTEKQASIDELSSTLAHEIRNPIAAAKSLVQQMGEDPTSVENVQYAHVALDELDRVERRISHLLKYAKEEDYTFALVNVSTVVDSALTQIRAKLDAAKVQVARNYISGPTVLADGEKLRQVFTNVLDNSIDAFEAVKEGRRIDLFVENGAKQATVRLRDNGSGIPADKIDRVFNPFFTTKDKGTGLGMAISKKIVEAHQGTIDVVSEVGRGTEFVITIPLPQ